MIVPLYYDTDDELKMLTNKYLNVEIQEYSLLASDKYLKDKKEDKVRPFYNLKRDKTTRFSKMRAADGDYQHRMFEATIEAIDKRLEVKNALR